MERGIGWKLIILDNDSDPWKLYLMFLSREIDIKLSQMNWVFDTNSDFIIPISLQPIVVDLRYFKIWILLHQIILVWNIKSLQHQFPKIGIRKFEFVTKAQFLYTKFHVYAARTPTKESESIGPVSLSVSRDQYTALPLVGVLVTKYISEFSFLIQFYINFSRQEHQI